MKAKFSGCAMVTHWFLHTPVQIFFCLVLIHKKVWCSLSSLNIQTGVLAVTFHITLLRVEFCLFSCLLCTTLTPKGSRSLEQNKDVL